jgi:hypothetical protein
VRERERKESERKREKETDYGRNERFYIYYGGSNKIYGCQRFYVMYALSDKCSLERR